MAQIMYFAHFFTPELFILPLIYLVYLGKIYYSKEALEKVNGWTPLDEALNETVVGPISGTYSSRVTPTWRGAGKTEGDARVGLVAGHNRMGIERKISIDR